MSILDDIALVSEYAQHYGNYVAVVCPFHDDSSPSLMVYEDWFRCLSCGKQGKPEYLLRKLQGYTPKAVEKRQFSNPWRKWIKAYGSVWEAAVFAYEVLKENPAFGDYLSDRRIPPEPYKLGYLHEWYTIPILSSEKRLQGVVARAGNTVDAPTRYVTPKDQEQLLYVPNWNLLNTTDRVYLTFGMFDAISICEIFRCGITTTTGKSVNPELLRDIQKPIYIIPDHGEERDAYNLAAQLGWRGRVVKISYPAGCKDPNDLLKIGELEKTIREMESEYAY